MARTENVCIWHHELLSEAVGEALRTDRGVQIAEGVLRVGRLASMTVERRARSTVVYAQIPKDVLQKLVREAVDHLGVEVQ